MKKLEIYDPALCCATGVCGPSPDAKLAAFAGVLRQLAGRVDVRRFNLAQEPAAFAGNPRVQEVLQKDGPEALPLVFVDGEMVMKRVYPSREQLNDLLSLEPTGDGCSEEGEGGCCEEGESGCCEAGGDDPATQSHASGSCCDDGSGCC